MRRSLFRALPGLALLAALAVTFAPQASAERTWSVPRAVSMYRFPVAAGQLFSEQRTDRGQDFATRPGGQVLALGRGLVMTNRGYFPGRTVVLQLLDGPFAGRFVARPRRSAADARPGDGYAAS